MSLGVQLIVGFRFQQRVGRGRFLSRPLWRFRLFAPRVHPWGDVIASYTRVKQMFVMIPVYCVAALFLRPWHMIYFGILIARYMDDYLTGDDDQWRRFKSWARNKIKWKTPLPAAEQR